MNLSDLFSMGAALIEGNSDSATTGMDTHRITEALGGVLTHGDGSLDLTSVVVGASRSGLGNIIDSWLGNGANMPITAEQIASLLGDEKIAKFASSLGISTESAKGALADSLPSIVDRATSGGDSIVDEMVKSTNGGRDTMALFGKIFG